VAYHTSATTKGGRNGSYSKATKGNIPVKLTAV
jgi:hypothetical protein